MRTPKRKSEEFRRKIVTSAYLTEEAVEQLRQDLRALQVQLPELIAETMRTKENGDLSENAEYQDAKHRLRRTHSEIASLKARIARAEIIPKHAGGAAGHIGIGSTVVLESHGKRMTYTILGSYESKPEEGKISDHSPLGTALLGKQVGESIHIETKRGAVEYIIKEVT